MTTVVFFPMLLLVFGIVIVLPIVLIVMLLSRRRKPPATAFPASPSTPPEARNQRREAILERLAKKELSREDAEQQLLELDKPLPEQLPATPPPPRNGCRSGCLVAVICGIIAIPLFFLLLFGSLRMMNHVDNTPRTQSMIWR